MKELEYGIGLGSNQGKRLDHLRTGLKYLEKIPTLTLVACSSIYETEGVDVPEPYRTCTFLNAVCVVNAALEPEAFLHHCLVIEQKLGRVRRLKNGPRSLDLDLIYAGDREVCSEELVLPHPRWQERLFVMVPLAEVRPHLVLPGQELSVEALLATTPCKEKIARTAFSW